ncbi:hypothetical protein ScPMuIL_010061 [Solemya velum]
MADSLPAEKQKESHECIDVTTHTFVVPQKEILEPSDIEKWEHSEAYKDLNGFILAINTAVKGLKMSDNYPVNVIIQGLLAMLDKMDKWIDEFPPLEQPQRFGNKAFRSWFTKLKENAEALLLDALGEKYKPAFVELQVYLTESVGNEIRIDYGSGHELAFAVFLCCLYKIGVLEEEDAKAAALKLFGRYLELVRRLQLVYRMEPAGSHGVWSLDDHQFIPFIWGSSQLIDHPRILPKSFVKPDIFEHFSKDYMFLGCVNYINKVKTGPFAEHSNQLWNISGVPHWSKVNSGLLKMYKAEVLAKFPVIQHFLFGSLMSVGAAT